MHLIGFPACGKDDILRVAAHLDEIADIDPHSRHFLRDIDFVLAHIDFFHQQIDPAVFAVEVHLHRSAVRRPRDGRHLPCQVQTYIVAQKRLVAVVGKKHPLFRLPLAQPQEGLFPGKLHFIGLFLQAPCEIASASDLYLQILKIVFALGAQERQRGTYVFGFGLHILIGLGDDGQDRHLQLVIIENGRNHPVLIGGVPSADRVFASIAPADEAIAQVGSGSHFRGSLSLHLLQRRTCNAARSR